MYSEIIWIVKTKYNAKPNTLILKQNQCSCKKLNK